MKFTGMLVAMSAVALVVPAQAQNAAMTPAQAIAAATAASSGEVSGTFEFVVGSTGAGGYSVYLNSAADYHDPGNLTAELHAEVNNKLHDKLGAFPQDVLTGKRVRIKGVAKRIPITARDGSKYFQTRIDVDTMDQIQILG